ncbi:MAG: type II toxin-antitoxin system PemK/MazF family toxin [Candidatus Binatia bacterium]
MVTPATRAVVSVRFPFSDLSRTKLRPVVILADVGREDWILCQVTSKPYGDTRAITLTGESFATGSLRVTSYARPEKLFTANYELMVGQVGILKEEAFKQIVEAVVAVLRSGLTP